MKHKKNSSIPIIVLITAWVFVMISYYLGTRWDNSLFSRSGSMMVLLAVVAKHILLKERNRYHHQQLRALSDGKPSNFEKVHPTKKHHRHEIFANVNIVLGTVIWGYGGLIV